MNVNLVMAKTHSICENNLVLHLSGFLYARQTTDELT